MKQLLGLFLSVIFSWPVLANNVLESRPEPSLLGDTAVVSTYQEDFLPAEQAFRLEKNNISPDAVSLQFIVAQKYYLYKDRFSFTTDNPQVTVGVIALPQGDEKQDEFFGKVEVYHNILDIVVPINNPKGLSFNLIVKYQGCADKGLCYPMETTQFAIKGTALQAPSTIQTTPHVLSIVDSLALLSWSGLFYYFIIGLGLAFTPCVFPMLPILSGIVLKGKTGGIRAQLLAVTYILFMALTYALFGALMGMFGAGLNLQARLQSAWVLIPFAVFFVLFALAMFGLFELKLPGFITNPLHKTADKTKGGSFVGAAILGICSSLVVSPCVTAPFAGILLHISATGDAVGGGISLFMLGIGMGFPLFVIAAGGSALLPKAGLWMLVVRNIFGVMLLGVAILLISRVIPSYIQLLLWGLLASGVAVFMGTFDFSVVKNKLQRTAQVLGLFLMVYAVCAWVGAWQGNSDPLQPLKENFLNTEQVSFNKAQPNWRTIKTKAELDTLMASAKVNNKQVLLDWSADWCQACLEMERYVFNSPEVSVKLANFELIRMDISKTTDEQRQMLNTYKLFGPPAILFFNPQGEEIVSARIVGEIGKDAFLKHLDGVFN